jgi:hypothetical protein
MVSSLALPADDLLSLSQLNRQPNVTVTRNLLYVLSAR